MATVSSSPQSVAVNSTITVVMDPESYYYTRSSNTGTGSVTCSVSVPAGSTITGSRFSCTTTGGTLYGGTTKINGTTVTGAGPHYVDNGTALSITVSFSFKSSYDPSAYTGNPKSTYTQTRTFADCVLTVDYIEPDPEDPGSISINKSSLTAGESLTVSITGSSSGVYRDVYIQKMPSNANILSVVQGHGTGAGSWTVTIPESWCETLSPNDPSFEVRIYMVAYVAGGTIVGNGSKMLTVNVPASAVPTIDDFTAALNSNGVDASITKYVQNYSKVNLEMSGVAGALGSSIASYEITGGGFSAAASSATMGPFGQTGDITFTAKVTDTRGRTATRAVTINVLPYTPVSAVSISAFRSDSSGDPDDEGTYAALKGKRVYSLLGGENTATISGRVFEKGTTPSSWSSMTDDTSLLIGSLSIEKGYTAQITVADKITSVVYVVEIPTSIVGLHILPGATGAGIGMYGVADRLTSRWQIYVGDDRVALQKECPHRIGDVIFSIVSDNPAAAWPATAWTALPTGKFIRVGTGGNMGGNDVHAHGAGTLTAKITTSGASLDYWYVDTEDWNTNWQAPISGSGGGTVNTRTNGVKVGGLTDNADNIPQYFELYAWRRTA